MKWYLCQYCQKKILLYNENAQARGIFFKCKKCGKIIEIKLKTSLN